MCTMLPLVSTQHGWKARSHISANDTFQHMSDLWRDNLNIFWIRPLVNWRAARILKGRVSILGCSTKRGSGLSHPLLSKKKKNVHAFVFGALYCICCIKKSLIYLHKNLLANWSFTFFSFYLRKNICNCIKNILKIKMYY